MGQQIIALKSLTALNDKRTHYHRSPANKGLVVWSRMIMFFQEVMHTLKHITS